MEAMGSPSKYRLKDLADSMYPVTLPSAALSSVIPPVPSILTSSPGMATLGSIFDSDGGTITSVIPETAGAVVAVGLGAGACMVGAVAAGVGTAVASGTVVGVVTAVASGKVVGVGAAVGTVVDVAAVPPQAANPNTNTAAMNETVGEASGVAGNVQISDRP